MSDDGDNPTRPLPPQEKEQERLRLIHEERDKRAYERSKENTTKHGEDWKEQLRDIGIDDTNIQTVLIADAALKLGYEQGHPYRQVPPNPDEYISADPQVALAKAAELLKAQEQTKEVLPQPAQPQVTRTLASSPVDQGNPSHWQMTADEVLGRFNDPAARARYHQQEDQRAERQTGSQAGSADTQPGQQQARHFTPPQKPPEKTAEEKRFEEITSRFTRENLQGAKREITGRGRGGRHL